MNTNSLPVWQQCYSSTHQKHYWFNAVDGTSVWEKPKDFIEDSGTRKRSRDESDHDVSRNVIQSTNGVKNAVNYRPKVAIIVPFRDLHVEQNRQAHLNRFIPFMTNFLSASREPFRIYIIEQSNDGRKFNRGKLLNIGFEMARADGAEIFIFHDVDLLPSPELLPYYTAVPKKDAPMHIASVWHRYTANPRYFGGVNAFSSEQFLRMNGFPNNFWGWGGEDDELFKRSKEAGFSAAKPTKGTLQDLEEMTIQQKMSYLKSHSTWKCMNRNEVLEEHDATWQTNGLRSLNYHELSRIQLNANSVRIIVDLLLNDHWSDLVSGIDDTQFDVSADILRAQFAAQISTPTTLAGAPSASSASTAPAASSASTAPFAAVGNSASEMQSEEDAVISCSNKGVIVDAATDT